LSPSSRDAGGPASGALPGAVALPQKINRYVIKRLLGKGAQGAVYHAFDPNFALDVAIKVLHPDFKSEEFLERFKLDAITTVRLNAPNVVRVFDFDPQYPYLAMEYCGDGDLNRYIKTRRRRSLAESLSITRQICEALVAAHENDPPILHRDIKPGNILFQKGVPKVADFGLAKMLSAGGGLTTTRGMMGTVRYCSPEQLRDASKVDHRADLWSVGVVLYELLTWARPFDKTGDNFVNIALRVHTEPPRKPPYDIPAPVLSIIQKALQKDPDQRYASAREMRDAVDRALRSVPDADRLMLPPEQIVDETSRMAAQVADLLDQGAAQNASVVVKEMRRVAPEDSVATYWHHRLREVVGGSGSSSGSDADTNARQRADRLARRLESIQSLIKTRNYREARRQVGEILVQEPDNTVVQRLLETINEDEGRLRDVLDRAHQEADRARAAGDYRKVHEAWKRLHDAYPDFPDAQAELAVARREMEIQEQRRARERVAGEAARLKEAGDLEAALAAWQGYTTLFPADQEAERARRELQETLAERVRAARLAALRSRSAQLRAAGDLKSAQALWRDYLSEDPASTEAAREARELSQEIESLERGRRLAEARATALDCMEAQDPRGALEAWRGLLAHDPAEEEAKEQVRRLEQQIAEAARQALMKEVELLASGLSGTLQTGRYRGVPGAGPAVSKVLQGSGAALHGDAVALAVARNALLAAREDVETQLARELEERRGRLMEKMAECRDWLPGEGASSDRRAGGAGQVALERALAAALAALCDARGADSPGGDPLEPLAAAQKDLDVSASALAQERQQALQDTQTLAHAALGAAQEAIAAYAGVTDAGEAVERASSGLEERWRRLRTQAESRAPDKLAEVERQARLLRAEADAARLGALWTLSRELETLLDEARSSVLLAGSDRLADLIRRASLKLARGEAKEGTPAESLAGLRRDLADELAIVRRAREESVIRAGERWQNALAEWRQVLASDLGPTRRKAGEEVAASGAAALAGWRADELLGWAVQLEGLTRRYRLESAWIDQSNSLLEIEGPPGQDSLPQDEIDPAARKLLARYRKAVAAGNEAEVRALGPAIEQQVGRVRADRGGPTPPPADLPPLSRSTRRFNQRYAPAALDAFDDLAARYQDCVAGDRRGEASRIASEIGSAYRRLIQPPPFWRRPAIPAGGAVILAAVLTLLLGQGRMEPSSVTILSPGDEIQVTEVTRDGEAVEGLDLSIGEEGVIWENLEPGRYAVTISGGARTEFDVPGQSSVLLPSDAGAFTKVILEELGLDVLRSER
jgi:serine/threonine protein kinase